MPLSQSEYLWSGATPLLLISPGRFFLYKGPKIDYFLPPPLDYRLLFALVSCCSCHHCRQLHLSYVSASVDCQHVIWWYSLSEHKCAHRAENIWAMH
jgi:hypothetical protein